MDIIVLAALLTCTTGQAECTAIESKDAVMIYVCGVEPESAGAEPAKLKARLHGETYKITITPDCEST